MTARQQWEESGRQAEAEASAEADLQHNWIAAEPTRAELLGEFAAPMKWTQEYLGRWTTRELLSQRRATAADLRAIDRQLLARNIVAMADDAPASGYEDEQWYRDAIAAGKRAYREAVDAAERKEREQELRREALY